MAESANAAAAQVLNVLPPEYPKPSRVCAGCLVLSGAAGGLRVVCARPRWTRSGMKTLMHVLNGADKWSKNRVAKAVKHCTIKELELLARGAHSIWADPLLPWCREGALPWAKKIYPTVLAAVKAEAKRRADGGNLKQDKFSMMGLPKGTLEDTDKSAWEGALRELWEETGISKDEVHVDKSFNTIYIKAQKLTMFVVRVNAGTHWESDESWSTPNSLETVEGRWVSLDQLQRMVTQMAFPKYMKAVITQLANQMLHR